MKKSNNGKIRTIDLLLMNIPNFFTISRIVLTFVVAYMIFVHESIIMIVIVFSIAALTDFVDGKLARAYKWESEFGRKADIIADRFLWIGTALAFIISYGIYNRLDWHHGVQIMFIMSREILTIPFAIIAFFSGNALPKARYVAKVTTFLQGFALPALILSTTYPVWAYVSWPLSIIVFFTGLKSALYYMNDVNK